MLLESGADAESNDECGQTPLHITCWYGHVEIVWMLKWRMVVEALAQTSARDNGC